MPQIMIRRKQFLKISLAKTHLTHTMFLSKLTITGLELVVKRQKPKMHLKNIPAGQNEETNWGSMRTENLVPNRNEDIWDADPPPEEPWVIKLDRGDIVDA